MGNLKDEYDKLNEGMQDLRCKMAAKHGDGVEIVDFMREEYYALLLSLENVSKENARILSRDDVDEAIDDDSYEMVSQTVRALDTLIHTIRDDAVLYNGMFVVPMPADWQYALATYIIHGFTIELLKRGGIDEA